MSAPGTTLSCGHPAGCLGSDALCAWCHDRADIVKTAAERDQLEDRLDQFEAYGYPTVKAVLDLSAERDQLRADHAADLVTLDEAADREEEWTRKHDALQQRLEQVEAARAELRAWLDAEQRRRVAAEADRDGLRAAAEQAKAALDYPLGSSNERMACANVEAWKILRAALAAETGEPKEGKRG